MGNYATSTDLSNRFANDAEVAHLTDTSESGVPDTDVLDEIIGNAEGQIDSYAARKYKTPLTTTDDTVFAAFLKSITLDIAVFHLLSRGDLISDAKTLAHDKAIDWLEKLAKGGVVPPATATQPTTEARDPIAAFGTAGTGDDSNRLFSRETQKNL